MSSMIIIAAMITVLLGATAYALLNASAGLTSQIDRATTETRLEQAARGVLANIVAAPTTTTNFYSVPAPDNVNASNVPSWIMANATNSRGVPFLYCPYSNNNTGLMTDLITVPSGSYGVEVNTLYTGSKNYIIRSNARPSNAPTALAIIVAPGEKAATAGDCTTIATNGTITGSTVRVITEADVMARDTINASRGEQYYVATSATGDGSGRNPGNRATLDTAITHINRYRPVYARMDLASGTYSPVQAVFSQAAVSSRPLVSARASAIDIRGAGTGSTILRPASSYSAKFISSVYLQDLSVTPTTVGNFNIKFLIDRNSPMITNNVDLQYFTQYATSNFYALGPTNLYGVTGDYISLQNGSNFYANSTLNYPVGANYDAGFIRPIGSNFIMGSDSSLLVSMDGSSTGNCAHWTYGMADQYFLGSVTIQSATGNFSFACGTPQLRYYFSGATITSQTIAGTNYAGRIVVDRGTTFIGGSNAADRYLVGNSAEVFITNSTLGSVGTSALRPTFASLYLYSGYTYGLGAWLIGGGSNGGWNTPNLTVRNTGNNCWYGNAENFYVASNTPFYDGVYSRSLGSSGFEPWLIANRSSWYCNR